MARNDRQRESGVGDRDYVVQHGGERKVQKHRGVRGTRTGRAVILCNKEHTHILSNRKRRICDKQILNRAEP